ncbi:LysR family transcriptional regulator [Luteimonas sp. SJ-92]|uniref:LysR family transcriptional regulator n=1 Tax=Luteimonas salinisoli TaxID=2752307 RepID=A0A853JA02_9GAMM|nr:LysR substrate-binding domain-containing protein [Luteimonas salinisoli]NZA25993.1 LysR family transcriptional regulator [Luteimonas salinisoli]
MKTRADWLPALAAFESAARHQNFAHAAEELHLTASAVSHHVRKLEARMGVPLFQRHARGVSLTAEGRQLADAAGSAITDIDGVVQALRSRRDERHVVRVTTLHSLTHSWLLPRLADFAAAHPDLRVHVDTEVALTRFDDGGPDLGIRHGPGHWPGLSSRHLMDETMFPVASPSLPGLSRIRGAGDIAALPLLADNNRQGWHDWFRHAGHHGVRIDPHYVFSDSTDVLEAAAHGLGIGLARQRIVAPWLENGRLRQLPGPEMTGRFAYYIVHPSHRRLRPEAQALADWMLAQAPD